MNDSVAAQTTQSIDQDIAALKRAIEQVNQIVVGKSDVIQMAFACLLSDGHLLLEDLPGLGKTTLAQSLAVTTGLNYNRIQFTSDMLPADILGVSIYSREAERFDFHPGPIFAQVVLADEVNRATPKTQSALLEAMAERRASIEGTTHRLPKPFFVIATQNPVDLAGTFPLPDSQLDRFLMKLGMGYPDPEAERRLLEEPDRQSLLYGTRPVLDSHQLIRLQQHVLSITASPALIDYLQSLVQATRESGALVAGLSPRAALALLRCTRAHAMLAGRDHCLPEDLQSVWLPVASHRLLARPGQDASVEEVVSSLIEQVPVA